MNSHIEKQQQKEHLDHIKVIERLEYRVNSGTAHSDIRSISRDILSFERQLLEYRLEAQRLLSLLLITGSFPDHCPLAMDALKCRNSQLIERCRVLRRRLAIPDDPSIPTEQEVDYKFVTELIDGPKHEPEPPQCKFLGLEKHLWIGSGVILFFIVIYIVYNMSKDRKPSPT